MFTSLEHTTTKMQKVTSLSNVTVTQQILNEALEKVSLLTGLSQAESLTLTRQLLLGKTHNSEKNDRLVNITSQIPVAVLEHTEVKFISNLFH